MSDCPKCGLPVKEGELFCNACGAKLPRIVKQSFCPVCANTLLEGEKVCRLCGTKVGGDEDEKTAAEVLAKQKEAMKNPTMDELYVPVITDEMLGIKKEPVQKPDDLPTMDAVRMPGEEDKSAAKEPEKVRPSQEPLPMPTIISADGTSVASQPVQVQSTPSVAPTPTVNNTYQQQTIITPEGKVPVQNQGSSHPQNNPKPGKSIKEMLPMILIAAIVLVILLDVFVVFRKQIFGGNKDAVNIAQTVISETNDIVS